MRVCNCCYDPEVIPVFPGNPAMTLMVKNSFLCTILVPDSTTVHGDTSEQRISHDVLEAAGMRWEGGLWRLSDGSLLGTGTHDITNKVP